MTQVSAVKVGGATDTPSITFVSGAAVYGRFSYFDGVWTFSGDVDHSADLFVRAVIQELNLHADNP